MTTRTSPTLEVEIALVGGGLVGSAIAWGLARAGRTVAVLDEGDVAYRASRGNFGLVWVQSKGLGMPEYAGWTKRSSDSWAGFAAELKDATGIDVSHQRPGGFHLVLSEEELADRASMLQRLHNQPAMIQYPYEIMDRAAVEKVLPMIGPEVAGASYCPLDGHVNVLKLLRALHAALAQTLARYLPATPVTAIAPGPDGFRLQTPGGEVRAQKVVLTAGLGNAKLAPMVGLSAPVRPQRGQIVVTERTAPFLGYPLATIRQTDEGSVMLGDSVEESGFDDGTRIGVSSAIAERAIRLFPALGRLNVVRTWAALRVMTPDGFPVYQQSESCPGAFVTTCHSGVTLAAAHALALAPMIAAGALAPEMGVFHARRFDVPTTA